jgi:predicted regulator of amino acid metabolism with ACT domain
VAQIMIQNGIRLDSKGRFYVGPVRITDTAIARAAGVDRRAVRETAKFILSNRSLASLFLKLRPFGSSLVDIAKALGYSVLRIESDPHSWGVISDVTSVLAKHRIVVRQALADDPDLIPEPRLTLVVEGRLPPEAVEQIRSLKCVKSLTLPN